MKSFLDSYMREVALADKVFVVHTAFWLSIIFIRIFIDGFNSYLFSVLGVFLVAFSVIFFKKAKLISLIIIGIGVSFLVNDFYSALLFFSTSKYWSFENLAFIIFIGIIPVLWLRKNFLDSPDFAFPTALEKHTNPKNPIISVVIPAYNEEKFLHNALSSMLAQTYKEFELLVVDNNSTDKTKEVAESFGARVIVEKKVGVAHARNTGFYKAEGEIVASTDSDTVAPENWVEEIVKNYKKNESLVGFGGLSLLYSGPVTARAAARFLFPVFWTMDKILSGGWNMSGFNMSVKKSSFLKIGGFKVDLKMNEDVDLSKRLRETGKIKIDKELLVFSSGRRYKNGLLLGVLVYAPSWIVRTILKKDANFPFPTVRNENSIAQKFIYAPLMIIVALITILFLRANNLL